MMVLLFPPRAFFNSLVRAESRKGTVTQALRYQHHDWAQPWNGPLYKHWGISIMTEHSHGMYHSTNTDVSASWLIILDWAVTEWTTVQTLTYQHHDWWYWSEHCHGMVTLYKHWGISIMTEHCHGMDRCTNTEVSASWLSTVTEWTAVQTLRYQHHDSTVMVWTAVQTLRYQHHDWAQSWNVPLYKHWRISLMTDNTGLSSHRMDNCTNTDISASWLMILVRALSWNGNTVQTLRYQYHDWALSWNGPLYKHWGISIMTEHSHGMDRCTNTEVSASWQHCHGMDRCTNTEVSASWLSTVMEWTAVQTLRYQHHDWWYWTEYSHGMVHCTNNGTLYKHWGISTVTDDTGLSTVMEWYTVQTLRYQHHDWALSWNGTLYKHWGISIMTKHCHGMDRCTNTEVSVSWLMILDRAQSWNGTLYKHWGISLMTEHCHGMVRCTNTEVSVSWLSTVMEWTSVQTLRYQYHDWWYWTEHSHGMDLCTNTEVSAPWLSTVMEWTAVQTLRYQPHDWWYWSEHSHGMDLCTNTEVSAPWLSTVMEWTAVQTLRYQPHDWWYWSEHSHGMVCCKHWGISVMFNNISQSRIREKKCCTNTQIPVPG